MGKVIGTIAAVAAGVALIATGVGAIGGAGIFTALSTATYATLGVSLSAFASIASLAAVGLSVVGSLVSGSKVSPAQLSALTLSFDPLAPRTIALGTGIVSTDVVYWEPGGTNQEYADYIIVLAAHEIDGVDQIYTETNLLWSAGGIQPNYTGYCWIDIRTVGTSSNGIAINGGSTWTSACTLTGCAYIHLRIKRAGASSKADSPFASGLPSSMRIIGRCAKLYDPRQDSTNGGSGAMRPDDQTTWVNASIGGNHALQALTYLLGWRINGVVSVGVGMPPIRLAMADWITAANICDEALALSTGGTQPRYSGGGIFSDTDAPTSVLQSLCTHMNAELRDVSGKLGIRIAHNDLSGSLTHFDESDIIGAAQRDYGPALNDGFNALRGQISDPSTASLYQLAPYGGVKIASVDGIDRPSTLDLPLCHSTEAAQRIATQVLIREQYQDGFTADFGPRMWAKRVGDPITLSFAACGFVNQIFRILSMENKVVLTDADAQQFCTVTLQVDDPAVYAWTPGAAVLPLAAVPSIPYNPRNNPLATIQGSDIGVQNGADVTALNAPTISVPSGVAVNYDYTGTPIAGQLPVTLQGARLRGNTDVSTAATWSVAGSNSCTVSVDSTGLATITAVAATGFVAWSSTIDGVTLTDQTTVTKNRANPPSTGGGGSGTGGTSAYTSSISPCSSASYGSSATGVLTVTTGTSGNIGFAASLNYTGNGTAIGKWQWRAVGGTFADAPGGEITSSDPATASHPGEPGETGDISIGQTKTGLSPATNYEVQLLLRRSGGSTALNFSGAASAVGS